MQGRITEESGANGATQSAETRHSLGKGFRVKRRALAILPHFTATATAQFASPAWQNPRWQGDLGRCEIGEGVQGCCGIGSALARKGVEFPKEEQTQ